MTMLCRTHCRTCGWESDWFHPSFGHKPTHFCIDPKKENEANDHLDELGLKSITAETMIGDRLKDKPKASIHTPDRYRWTWRGVTFDFYRLCDILGITNHAHAHALKKVIRAGKSIKPIGQDIDEAVDCLLRWKEMIQEDKDRA